MHELVIYIYRKRNCQEYVKLNWGLKMEQTNNRIKRFARMESAWVFNVGLLFPKISIPNFLRSMFEFRISFLAFYPQKADHTAFLLPAGRLILWQVWAANRRLSLANWLKSSAKNTLSSLSPTNSSSSWISTAFPTPTANTVTFFSCNGRTASSSVLESDVTVCFPSVNTTITLATPVLAPPARVNTLVFATSSALSMRVYWRWCFTRFSAALKSLTFE